MAAEVDVLQYLPQPPLALAAELQAHALAVSPAIVRSHPIYKHEVLLVRPQSAARGIGTDWTLPTQLLTDVSNKSLASMLKTIVSQEAGLEVRGVIGGRVVEVCNQRRSGSATFAAANVFFVVRTTGELIVNDEAYSEWMWAKAAEIPALQLHAETRRAVVAALKMASAVV